MFAEPSVEIMQMMEQYLAELRRAAAGAPSAAREEFLAEIRSHILDRIAAECPLTPAGVRGILDELGDPAQLGRQFAMDAMLRRAAKGFSPWLLVRGTLRWAMAGFWGLVAFAVTIFGYGSSLVGYLVAILKPFLPDRIGLWLSPGQTLTLGYWDGHVVHSEIYGISLRANGSFALGTLVSIDGPVHEWAGYWIYLIGLLVGVLFLINTTLFVRWMVRRYGVRKWRSPAARGAATESLLMRTA